MTAGSPSFRIDVVPRGGIVGVFSPRQVQRLTGLSARQLAYWDKTGFFEPAITAYRHERFGRVYSFEDVVGLRVIALLRRRVPLQELRRVGSWLHDHRGSWAGRQFWVRGKRVYWDDDEGQRIGARAPQQAEMRIEMDAVAEDVRSEIAALRRRSPDQVGKVERHRFVAGHEPVLAGTRIPARAIRQLHDAGYTSAAIRAEYPQVTDADIEAALATQERRRAS